MDLAHGAVQAKAKDGKLDSTRPIFICGCGHSGTTLVLRLIARIEGAFACNFCETNWAVFPSKEAREAALQSLEEEARKHGARRLVEKSPMHVFYMRNLLSARSDSRVVLCMRDGRDVAASRAARTLNHDVKPGIHKWAQAARIALEWQDCDRVHVLKYEDLINPESRRATLHALSTFIGEDLYEEYLLRGQEHAAFNGVPPPAEVPTIVNTRYGHGALRSWQFNQPLFDGRGRWKGELSDEDIRIVLDIGGDLIAKFASE